MSELDVSLLVRHTRLLLRFYPPGYRAHRGEEILDTLLETTRPGRGWPPPREVASVIGGGLRARRAANLNQGLRASLRHVGILAAAMIMIQTPAALLSAVGQRIANLFSTDGLPYGMAFLELGLAMGSLLVVMALAASWCGRRWLVAAAVVAAALAAVACLPVLGGWWKTAVVEMAVPAVVALVVLLPLTKRAERPPVSLLWLPCLPLAVNFVAGLAAASGLHINDALFNVPPLSSLVLLAPYNTYLSLVPVLVAVCWLATDVRPLAAVALQFLLMRVLYAAFGGYSASWTQMAMAVGLSLALTCALVWLLRHRGRTAPPSIG